MRIPLKFTILSILCLFIGAAVNTSAAEISHLKILAPDRLLLGYINLSLPYNALIDQCKVVNKPENAQMRKDLDVLFAKSKDELPLPLRADNVQAIIDRILSFNENGYFIPTGGLWIGFGKQKDLILFIEGKCKPVELIAYLNEISGEPLPPHVLEGDVAVFRKPDDTLTFSLAPNGLMVSTKSMELTPSADVGRDFLRIAGNPENYFVAEISGDAFKNLYKPSSSKMKVCAANLRLLSGAVELYNLDNPESMTELDLSKLQSGGYLKGSIVCPESGNYSCIRNQNGDVIVTCSVHNHLDDMKMNSGDSNSLESAIQSMTRARIILGTQKCLVMAAFDDKAGKPVLKEELEKQLEIYKPIAEKFLSEIEAQNKDGSGKNAIKEIRNIVSVTSIIDQGQWIGLQSSGLPLDSVRAMPAVIGILAAIAIPNFRRAREKAQSNACSANRRVLTGAIEMYNMDYADQPLKSLDIKKLQDSGLLHSEIICPSGGTYSAHFGPSGEIEIECSVHGK